MKPAKLEAGWGVARLHSPKQMAVTAPHLLSKAFDVNGRCGHGLTS
jgi:hypothetical protein